MSDLKPNQFKFIDSKLKKLPLPEQGMALYYDTEVKGLMLRITANGARTFVLRYRLKGREHHCRIGTYSITSVPDWSIDAARKEAGKLKEAVRNDKDPLEAKRTDRDAPTVKELCDRFIAEHLPKRRPGTQYEYQRAIAHDILPALGRKLVAEVNDTDVERLHRKITERGARARANTVVMYLSSIFSRALKWKMRPAALGNPCKGIEKNPEETQERFLEDEQIAKLMDALGKHEDRQASDILSLCLLTGARIGEIRSMRWDQIDLASGIWAKPSSSTKQKKPHRAHLNAPARQTIMGLREHVKKEIARIDGELKKFAEPERARLGELKRRTETFVFPSPTSKPGYRLEVRDQWEEICKAAGLVALRETRSRKTGKTRMKMMHSVRIHDLRHSHASLLASAGYSLPLIGKMLGHSRPETTARYAKLLDKPLREASEAVGALITGKNGEVIVLDKARRQ